MIILKRIKKNDFAVNVLKLISGTALGQMITVLVSPLLARIYAPEDFGLLAVYISIASILSVIISLRYETAVVLPEDDNQAMDLVLLASLVAFVFSIFLFIAAIIFKNQLLSLIGYPQFELYLYLVPLSTFFYGCYQVLSFWMTRLQRFNFLAVSKSAKEAAGSATQLGWGIFLYPGAFGLILGQISGNAFGFFFLLRAVCKQLRQRLTAGLVYRLKEVLIAYKKFPIYTSWATLINSTSQNIPALLLAVFFSPAIAGYYALATRVISLPVALIGNSVRQVYFQKATEIYNRGDHLFPIFIKTTLNLALLGLFPIVIIIIWGEPLFAFVLGAEWGEAGRFAAILSFWLFFAFVNPPTVSNLLILKQNRIQLIWEILLLLFRVLALVVGAYIYDDVYITLGLFTIAGIIFNFLLIAYMFRFLKKNSHLT